MNKLRILYPDSKMPYLIKDSGNPVGGASVEWLSWIKGFNENNCIVGVLTWEGARKFVKDNNHSINFIESYNPSKGIKKIRWFYYRLPRLIKAIKDFAPDVIIQECAGFETGIMCFIANLLNIPFMYRVANDMDTDERLKTRLNLRQRIFFKYALRHSDAILCQNNYQYQNLRLKYKDCKLHIIHNPFHLEKMNELNDFTKRSYIAWIGIFQYQKNLPALYKIVKSLPNVNFQIAGKKSSSSKLTPNIEDALEALSNCPNVKFVGYLNRTEVLPFLSKAYALLNTSLYEGFSNTYLEAMSTGTPIITTINANPDNLISEKKLGIVADKYDEVNKSILTLLNYTNYTQLSSNCRNHLVEYHNPKTLSEKIIRITSNFTK